MSGRSTWPAYTVANLSIMAAPSRLFEVDPLVHGQPLEIPAQAVEPHLDRAEAHPLAAAQDAAAPRGGLRLRRDRQSDGPAEVDPVGAFVEVDQDRQRVRDARLTARRVRHRLGRLARELAHRSGAVKPDGRAHLAEVAGDGAAAKDLLRAREVGEARGDRSTRERLDDRERGPTTRELPQDDALQRRIVLTENEVAEPLARFALDR